MAFFIFAAHLCMDADMVELRSVLAKTPSLYVVATPLGNLRDITLRALDVLRAVDRVAAEDTRHSRRLLDAHGIRAEMFALHQHNEQQAAGQLIAELAAGRHVALITDAGTPAVSDPGARAVARVRAAGYRVVPVPGPSAMVAALSASGLAEGSFHFHGFLPARSAARRAELAALRRLSSVLVFYEAPHRIAEMVDDLCAEFEPERTVVLARELTKQFEQIASLPLSEAPAWLSADPDRQRGEFVVLLSPPPPAEGLSREAERVLGLLLEELPLKTAAKLAAQITGEPKNALYARALELRGD